MQRSLATSLRAVDARAPVEAMPNYSSGLASLRGLAAATVIVYHGLLVFQVGEHARPHRTALDMSDGPLFALQMLMSAFNGPNAVILFFVLSGTVLTLSLDRAGRLEGPAVVSYYIRRVLRIVPLLAFVAALAALAHFVYAAREPVASGTAWMSAYFRHEPTASEFALNAIGWSNSLNSPTWTIRVELLASIVFPLLYIARTGPVVIALTLGALAAMSFVPIDGMRLHVFLISFYLGALVPLAAPFARRAIRALGPLTIAGLIVALIAFAAAVQMVYKPWIHVEPVRVLLVSPALALIVLVIYCGAANRFLATRSLTFLGDISYSMYLIHFGVLFSLVYIAQPFLPERLAPAMAIGSNLALAGVGLALTVVISTVTYSFIEKPFMDLGRSLSKRLCAAR